MNSWEQHLFETMNGVYRIGSCREKPLGIIEEQLIKLEADLAVRFPGDYREFVKRYGGCGVSFGDNDEFSCFKPLNPIPDPTPLGGGLVQYFFGGEDDPATFHNSLRFNNAIARPPHKYIAIGIDGIGGFFLIGVTNQNYGQMFYFVPESREWNPRVILIAQTFTEFVLSFYFEYL